MPRRPTGSKPSNLAYEYDLDILDKKSSRIFGKITFDIDARGVPTKFVLNLNPGIVEALYDADLADRGSYRNLVRGHFFTKTIDGHSFTYSIEPYGYRNLITKPNGVIVIFHPAEKKVGAKKTYTGYKDGETDEIFRAIMKTVAAIPHKKIRNNARTLKSLSIAIPNPNIARLMGEFATSVQINKKHNLSKTVKNLKAPHNLSKREYNRILEKFTIENSTNNK